MSEGWICPQCRASVAPSERVCPRCDPDDGAPTVQVTKWQKFWARGVEHQDDDPCSCPPGTLCGNAFCPHRLLVTCQSTTSNCAQ